MNKILVICGPTAAGKTALGTRLAKKFNGEILSADSRQVYTGMDIATGKDLPSNAKVKVKSEKLQIKIKSEQILKPYRFEGIPVWMLNVVRPNQEFSVAQYVELAEKVIKKILGRKKLPIIVGGTGFYIKALTGGLETLGIPPDWNLRKKLVDKKTDELFEMLARIDGEKVASLNTSDRKNPRRLIRAIEIALKNQKSPLRQGFKGQAKINPFDKLRVDTEQGQSIKNISDILFIGLTAPYNVLYKKVDERIGNQVEEGIKEIRRLLGLGYGWDLPAMTAMGYGILRPYIEGREEKTQVVQQWKYKEHAYVRRQMTWFKKDQRINWFDITEKSWREKVEQLAKNWYNSD